MLARVFSGSWGMRTLFQVQVAVLVVKVIAAHGAVEVVVRVHLAGVGCGRGW